jgi:hypothetical protein
LIDPDRLRIARGGTAPFEGRNDVFGPITEPRIDDGREPAERVHDGEHTDLLAGGQLVMDEVHGPDLIGCGSCATIVAQLRLHSSLGRLAAQLQAQTRVNPMRLLHVDLPALAAQKNMDAPVAIPDARLADLLDAGFKAGLLAAARFVMIRWTDRIPGRCTPAGSRRPNHRKPPSPARACEQALQFSADDVLKHLTIQRQVRDDLLQLRVLVLKLFQPPHLRRLHAVVLSSSN